MFEANDSVFTPEHAIGAVGADEEPYDLPEDFDPKHEDRDLHDREETQ